MRKVILDGNNMTSIKNTHKYLKEQLNLPSYYGENLDALWDFLTTISEPTCINLINLNSLYENLDQYANLLLEVIRDSSEENDNIDFHLFK